MVYPDGGFSYPKIVDAKDTTFYIYPYIDSLSTSDSMDVADYGHFLSKYYNEPNLSIRPLGQVTFRLLYSGWTIQTVIITLTENRITVKKAYKGLVPPYHYKEKLNNKEQEELSWAEWYFAIAQEKKMIPEYAFLIDSLLQKHPKMNDISYYQHLREKMTVYDSVPFQYISKSIPISKKIFNRLAKLINESGYWQMQRQSDCKDIPTDAEGFSLEANTPTEYKFVTSASCPDDKRKFTLACQEIVKYAGLDKEIKFIWSGEVTQPDTSDLLETPIILKDVK